MANICSGDKNRDISPCGKIGERMISASRETADSTPSATRSEWVKTNRILVLCIIVN